MLKRPDTFPRRPVSLTVIGVPAANRVATLPHPPCADYLPVVLTRPHIVIAKRPKRSRRKPAVAVLTEKPILSSPSRPAGSGEGPSHQRIVVGARADSASPEEHARRGGGCRLHRHGAQNPSTVGE